MKDMRDLRERLRNLRAATPPVTRPAASPYRAPFERPTLEPLSGTPQPLESLVQGELYETPYGASYLIRTPHAPDHVHGEAPLEGWLSQNLAGAALFSRDERLASLDPRRCLFLDTETTGLNYGAGTLVFLVGVGFFVEDGTFEVRQYFLRTPDEEVAMLHVLRGLLEEHEALVTFNGRSFDVPLLVNRYTFNRQRLDWQRWPNLDLLHPSRRLWKRRLTSCRLASLETSILGVQRTGADVPGMLIPQLYQEYLHTGDGRQMQRVLYHNLIDILSMVTLGAVVCETFSGGNPAALPREDLLSLARWYDQLGMLPQAEAAYGAAIKIARLDSELRDAMAGLAALFKRQNRSDLAEPLWRVMTELSTADPQSRIELAIYHEWKTHDLQQALAWTEEALHACSLPPVTYLHQTLTRDLEKRQARLLQKLNKTSRES